VTPRETRALVLRIRRYAALIRPEAPIRMSRDPTDDKFLECAVAGTADYIVSGDADLLSLLDVEGIPIVDAPTFWQVLASQASP
jgi:predicted nucleic acid-binding protein